MNCRPAGCCVLVLALALPSPALADPIRIVFENRFVVTSVNGGDGTELVTQQHDADVLTTSQTRSTEFSSGTGQATLTSSLAGPSRLVATSTAIATVMSTGSTRASADARSQLVVGFELDVPHTFDFSGTFSSSGNQAAVGTEGRWGVALSGGELGRIVFFHSVGCAEDNPALVDGGCLMRPPDVTPLSEMGLLAPGRWSLGAEAVAASRFMPGAGGTANSAFSFTLDLTPAPDPIPEPSTLLLLGTGAGLLVRARRRGLAGFSRER